MKINDLYAILLIQVICETLEYDLRCPVAGEWRQRPRKYKCGATQYVCLLFLPNNIYRETCDGLDYSSRGSKLVFEPNFNKAKCNYNRYQPFPFSTDGSSDCVYKKSLCNGEGQFVYHNGTLRNNTRCGCHFLHGFTFVTKPKNNCFCIPSEEDCSCHKITCNDRVLNSDTHCREDVAALLNTSCSDIIASLLPEKDPTVEDRQRRLAIGIDNYNKGRPYCSYITVVVLITLIGIAILMIYILITDHLNITVKKENEAKAIDGITELFLECEIDVPCSCLVRSIQWYKDNIECSSDPKKYDWNKKVPKLTFKTVDENVVGSYKCVVDTICTRHISKSMCVFYALPIITLNQNVIEIPAYETSVELSCEIRSESNLVSVQWYKDEDTDPIDSKNYVVRDNKLHVLIIQDVGVYKCVAKNEKGTSKSNPIQVVCELPIVIIKTDIIEISAYGTPVELLCEIESESNLISVQWHKNKDKVPINFNNHMKYDVREDKLHVLTIDAVIKSDIGFYKCVAKNEKGTSESGPILVLCVIEDQEQQSATLTESMAPTDGDNFYRLFHLIHEVGTNALRRFFNRLHSNLASDLNNPKSKAILMELHRLPRGRRQVLYRGQWDILYPPTGSPHVTTDDFDLTLMVSLLRHLPPVVQPPAMGFDMLPSDIENSDGANIACLKFYYNVFHHRSECSFSKSDFNKIWKRLEKAISGLDNSQATKEGLKIADAKRFHK